MNTRCSLPYGVYVDLYESGMACACGKIYVRNLEPPLPGMILCPSCAVACGQTFPEGAQYLKIYRDGL